MGADPTKSGLGTPLARVRVRLGQEGPGPLEHLVPAFADPFDHRPDLGRATRPVMELKGFRLITLAPGERRAVTFEVGPEHLSYHGPDLKRVVEPGRFRLMVGGSSAEVKSVGLDVVAP
jgi:hypothetical protein